MKEIERIGQELEAIFSMLPETRSLYTERIAGGCSVDFEPDRKALQSCGLTVGGAQMVVEKAIDGMEVSQTLERRERYTINVHYPRELRDDVEKLSRILVATPLECRFSWGNPANESRTHDSL